MRRTLAIVVVVVLVASVVTMRSCPRSPRDVRPAEAAAGLRAEPGFTTREHSPVGRDLVEILVVRRIGRSSCEVEFTWRDTAPPAGQPVAPLRTSMALFRRQDDGRWLLASLFKVD